MKVKEESEKVDLKLNIQKTKIMASGPITSWQIGEIRCIQGDMAIDFMANREKVEAMTDFIFLGSRDHF